MKTDGNETSVAESDHNDNRFFMMSRISGLSLGLNVAWRQARHLKLSIPVISLTCL